MARASKLKVFRTPIGFHDAYVAAPSRKAALEAWGAEADLFARGVAEQVDDPELMREPLAKPGTVVKRSRGTAAEQMAALPPDSPKRAAVGADRQGPRKPLAKPKPKPRPSRDALDEAERAIADADAAHAEKRAAIAEEEQRLARERHALDEAHEEEATRLAQRRDEARAAYDRAVKAWRG